MRTLLLRHSPYGPRSARNVNAPIAVAIQTGQRAAAIEMIAKKSGDVNAAQADGTTPLIWAANLNDTDLVSRALKAGASASIKNQARIHSFS